MLFNSRSLVFNLMLLPMMEFVAFCLRFYTFLVTDRVGSTGNSGFLTFSTQDLLVVAFNFVKQRTESHQREEKV